MGGLRCVSSHLAAVAREVGPTTQSFPGSGAVSGGEGMMTSPFELDQPSGGRARGGSLRDLGVTCLEAAREMPAEMATLLACCRARFLIRDLVAVGSSNPASSSLEMSLGPGAFAVGVSAAGVAEFTFAAVFAEFWSGAAGAVLDAAGVLDPRNF